MGDFYRVKMRVSLFHLAIIGQWSEIVRLFLTEVSQKLDSRQAFNLLRFHFNQYLRAVILH